MEPPLTGKPSVVFQASFLLFLTHSFYIHLMWSGDIENAGLQKYKLKLFRQIESITFHSSSQQNFMHPLTESREIPSFKRTASFCYVKISTFLFADKQE